MKPDYQGNGLVNLMSSLTMAMGVNDSPYPAATLLPPEEIKSYDNIIFMLIDGLGTHNISNHNPKSFISGLRIGDLTSVFPSTTAAAITTLNTALAPQQHAATGWFVYLREVATVSAILPFVARVGGPPFSQQGISVSQIVTTAPFYERLDRRSVCISPNYIVNSDYSKAMTVGAKRVGYDDLEGYFGHISAQVKSNAEKKYIYAYWPVYDSLCHAHGTSHEKTVAMFNDIDSGMEQLVDSLRNTNSLIVMTADHGLIDTSPDKTIHIDDFPDIQQCLRLPLCGEPRAAYCYVKPKMTNEFESLCRKHWADYFDLVPSESLVDQHYFGLFESHSEFQNRIGDYVLLAKENYIIKDQLPNEKPFHQVGVHGGLSEQEMTIPLVVARID